MRFPGPESQLRKYTMLTLRSHDDYFFLNLDRKMLNKYNIDIAYQFYIKKVNVSEFESQNVVITFLKTC